MGIRISIVVAVAENGVIGLEGDMPWHLSTDLKRFKDLTLGKPMIMGRKTFMAIGQALPGRTSIVITRDKSWQAEGGVPVHSLQTAFELAEQIAQSDGVDELCIVGGGEIYRQSLDRIDRLYYTHIHADFEGDTTFPEVDWSKWREVERTDFEADERHAVSFSTVIYERA